MFFQIFVVFHVIMHVAFSVQRFFALKDSEVDSVQDMPDGSEQELQPKNGSQDMRGSVFRKIGAILYVIFAWSIAIVLAFHIGLAKEGRDYWFQDGAEAEAEGEGYAEGEGKAEGEAE